MRVVLPYHLRNLAKVSGELTVEASTTRQVLDALESAHPQLRGTMRDPATGGRRAYVRFYACQEDWSHEDLDAELPEPVLAGKEPFLVIGAMSGG
ncbi:MAG: hypothetical protein EPN99_15825 [Frankiales bacterium]|nr:MAG: hypothetical protein EPN99_15825 [Frankiales bacterium]